MGHRRRDGAEGGRDSYRSERGAPYGGRESYRGGDRRDRDYDRDRGDYGRERDRDPYGRDNRDWRERRSPPPARGGGGRYSPDYRRRRSYSRSPPRGASPHRGGGRDYDAPAPETRAPDTRNGTDARW